MWAMRNREAELGGVICLEVTAAVEEQVVHEQTVRTLREAHFECSEDCDHLADLKRMALDGSCQEVLQ